MPTPDPGDYHQPPDVVARTRASQPAWITDAGRNVNGYICVGWAPGHTDYGTPMFDPADGAYVYVPGETEQEHD